ncbi:hypothetical protein [Aquabacter sediminis]|uniref:hypothetical protein n=1 Tax=Aquabacter sediminis TaxID=3029197 RepID=UPI00237D7FE2|nr:hypothetical protein [Aquabacter sp. P-9]MDE1569896.1 hypothetical protein [Aquabacter sp. P-9]
MTDLISGEMTKRPIFFLSTHAGDKPSTAEITKYYTTDDEVAEWERIMAEQVGLKIDGKAHIAGGGCCCGGGGGMCDAD